MRRALPAFLLCIAMAACTSTPPPATGKDKATTAAITVVGWSLRDQTPVPVSGVLRQGGRDVARFDTRTQPEGKTIENVEPGPYEVLVTHRIAGERLIAASGIERVDVRAGETVRCEVVVDDREGAEPGALESSR